VKWRRGWLLAGLALAASLAYLPIWSQPLLEDDYPNITLALNLGSPAKFAEMATTVFRLRATSLWLMNAAWHAFGMQPAGYYAISLALHVLCVWLIYALGCWKPLGYRVSAWAALFFAVYEGHQEAIMWFSACNESLQFVFGGAALLAWLRFLEGGRARFAWYAASLAAFFMALISKESAVILVPLLALPLLEREARRHAAWLAPFAALAGAVVYSVWAERSSSFRFADGSFSLSAPFWRIEPFNLTRLFWVWGFAALAALALWGWKRYRSVVLYGALWCVVALVPYSFLTYSLRIPSRQLYLASVGLAWIVGAALVALSDRFAATRRHVMTLAVLVLIVHNAGYLWTRKRAQFLRRAEPTERLIALAERTPGPIFVRCFPRPALVAQEALRLRTGRPVTDLVWNETEARARGAAAVFCYEER
jgi:hypothetical protein